MLERFHTRYPGLHVEFVTSDQYLDFAGGDVDVALRSGDTEDNALIGRKVGDSLWAVYASPKYIARCGQPDRVEDLARRLGWALTRQWPAPRRKVVAAGRP
ncbi:MAG: hypothetical protein IPK05_15995 [Comamonadaceae bacterium]|nr:hypothetical protein [Comamonadaceae bacterium]